MGDQRVSEKLSNKQLHTLKIIFKFRFVTSSLLAKYRSVNKNSLNRMLQNLVDQKYIKKQYDNSYRIDRMGARFSLASKGITYLTKNTDLPKKTLHAMYNQKSEAFIKHCLATFELANRIKQAYTEQFFIYSSTEISGDSDFPLPRPHHYLRRQEPSETKPNEFFIELHHDSQPFLIRKRFNKLLEHYDDEGWPDGDYPALLFVLASDRQAKTFLEYTQSVFESTGIDDMNVIAICWGDIFNNSPLLEKLV
jgi:DNA-binding MarR family transcriptional regulator